MPKATIVIILAVGLFASQAVAGEPFPLRGYFRTFDELWASVAQAAVGRGGVAGLTNREIGVASIFNDPRTACPPGHLTKGRPEAAHKTLPCGTRIMVRNVANGRTSEAWIVDRGPCTTVKCKSHHPKVAARILDMSPTLAKAVGAGDISRVEVTIP